MGCLRARLPAHSPTRVFARFAKDRATRLMGCSHARMPAHSPTRSPAHPPFRPPTVRGCRLEVAEAGVVELSGRVRDEVARNGVLTRERDEQASNYAQVAQALDDLSQETRARIDVLTRDLHAARAAATAATASVRPSVPHPRQPAYGHIFAQIDAELLLAGLSGFSSRALSPLLR